MFPDRDSVSTGSPADACAGIDALNQLFHSLGRRRVLEIIYARDVNAGLPIARRPAPVRPPILYCP